MIHLYSDRLMQRPKTVTMDTSHGDSKSEKQIPLLSRMWGHSAESHRSMQMTRSVPLVTGAVWSFRKSSKKVNGKQIKANTHILKAPEAGQKVIMTASNAKLFFPFFQGQGWNGALMNLVLLLDAFCVSLHKFNACLICVTLNKRQEDSTSVSLVIDWGPLPNDTLNFWTTAALIWTKWPDTQ